LSRKIRRKYSLELREKAEHRLKELLMAGNSYHKAAKKVSDELDMDIHSLRWRAYQLAQESGMDIGDIQHRAWTSHGQLMTKTKEKLSREGYEVIEEQNEIRKTLKRLGIRGNPDFLAKKEDDMLLVEVYTDDKKLIRQLNAYQEAGKVVLVLPVRGNVELWGLNHINTSKPIKAPSKRLNAWIK